MENNEGKLRKVPECGIFDFSGKIESIPEDTLVTTQAKREYLAHVWAKMISLHSLQMFMQTSRVRSKNTAMRFPRCHIPRDYSLISPLHRSKIPP